MSFEFIFMNKNTGYFLEQKDFFCNRMDPPLIRDEIQSSSSNLKELDSVIRNLI